MGGAASAQDTWNALCSALSYAPELKASGGELLQRLQSTQDKLGEQDKQARARQFGLSRLPDPSADPAPAPRRPRAQTKVKGQVAAAAYLASSKGKMLPGISVTQLTAHLSMHMKDFFNHVLEQHARLYPGNELTEIVPVRARAVFFLLFYSVWLSC